MKLSIVLSTYNGEAYITEQLVVHHDALPGFQITPAAFIFHDVCHHHAIPLLLAHSFYIPHISLLSLICSPFYSSKFFLRYSFATSLCAFNVSISSTGIIVPILCATFLANST